MSSASTQTTTTATIASVRRFIDNLFHESSFGWQQQRFYEQYGLYDAAAAAYQRVERPDGVIDPTDTFALAQSRLKALHRN
jgi:hypothetical protein